MEFAYISILRVGMRIPYMMLQDIVTNHWGNLCLTTTMMARLTLKIASWLLLRTLIAGAEQSLGILGTTSNAIAIVRPVQKFNH